jgi:DNA-directed RNA polymerase specialized sigma24 family protein
MSRRSESPPHAPRPVAGAHSAHLPALRTHRQSPAACAQYEPYLDGLFTYCLSALCEHDTATAALGDVLALAERQRGHRPAEDSQRRAWLYAVARWVCRERLAGKRSTEDPSAPAKRGGNSKAATEQRRELAALAWAEAAGTTPEQREALELAVRHGLWTEEVAAVLGMETDAAHALLAGATCEVERTRAALAVVERGGCPVVTRLTGSSQLLLGTGLRSELVRHVDECPKCRRVAEHATVRGPWPGSTAVFGTLRVLEAPRPAVYAAMARSVRTRSGYAGARPRYGRSGFPVDAGARAARRRRMRSRAVTMAVVGTVVAAPAIALWTAYQAQPTGERQILGSLASTDARDVLGTGTEKQKQEQGEAGSTEPGIEPRFRISMHSQNVSVEVIDAATGRSSSPRPAHTDQPQAMTLARMDDNRKPGRLTTKARPGRGKTVVKLRASAGSPVRWSAHADSPWVRLSRTEGVLRPGETVTITVSVEPPRSSRGDASRQAAIDPAEMAVTIEGHKWKPGSSPDDASPSPGESHQARSDGEPSSQTGPSPSPSPSDGSGAALSKGTDGTS